MKQLFRVQYHPTKHSVKPRTWMCFGDWIFAEDVLTEFKTGHPDATPLSVQDQDDRFLWTLKDELACPHCGGVDAHLPRCEGGYGL